MLALILQPQQPGLIAQACRSRRKAPGAGAVAVAFWSPVLRCGSSHSSFATHSGFLHAATPSNALVWYFLLAEGRLMRLRHSAERLPRALDQVLPGHTNAQRRHNFDDERLQRLISHRSR